MKAMRSFLILFLAGNLIQFQLAGQVRDSIILPVTWTIEQCISYAKDHNIQITTLKLNQQAAGQNLVAAKGSRIPSLSATVGNDFNNANNAQSFNGPLINQLSSNLAYSVNSSLQLWNGNAINNQIALQGLLVQSASLSVEQAQNNITLSITQAYLNILLAYENETYVRDLVNTTDSTVKQSQLFYDAGSIAKVSLLQLQAQLAGDKYLLVQAQNTIRLNLILLKQLLQLPTNTPFGVDTTVGINVPVTTPSLNEVQQRAVENFPDVKIGKLGVNISQFDVAIAKAAFSPTIRANGAVGSGYNDILTNNFLPRKNYFTQTGNHFYQTLGLAVDIPIFSQKLNQTNLEKARISLKQSNLELQNDQLVLTQAVEQAYIAVLNAKESYVAANQQLIAATESYRILNEELKTGAVNAYDLLQQHNQYIQAIQEFIQAKYTAVLQQKIYEYYMGEPVTL